MAFALASKWLYYGDIYYDGRQCDIKLNGAGTDYSGSTAFDYFPDTAVVGDALWFWLPYPPFGLRFSVGTPFAAASVTFVWEYYSKASGWTTLRVTNADAFTKAGQQDVLFVPPEDSYNYTNGGGYLYRCRIAALTGITEGGAQSGDYVRYNMYGIEVTGTETSLDGAFAADQAGSYTILPAIAPAASLAPYEMPVKALDRAAQVDVVLAGTTAGAGDTVVLTGIDLLGNTQTETIDVSGGNGTYTSEKYFQDITDVACNGFSGGTIQIDQKCWGMIYRRQEPEDPRYGRAVDHCLLRCFLFFGDGGTSTTVTLKDIGLRFWNGFYWNMWGPCAVTFGEQLYDGEVYEGAYRGVTIYETDPHYVGLGCYRRRAYTSGGDVILYMYGTQWRYTGNGYSAENIFVISDVSDGRLQDINIEVYGSAACRTVLPGTISYERIVFRGGSQVLYYNDSITISAARFCTSAYVFTYVQNNTHTLIECDMIGLKTQPGNNGVVELRDCPGLDDTNVVHGYNGTPSHTDGVRITHAFDLTIVDENNNPLAGIDWGITDYQGNLIDSGTTGASGQITSQVLWQMAMSHIKNGENWWTDYTPHTVTLDGSAVGYETRTIQYTMDRKREEVEMLEPATSAGGLMPAPVAVMA